ncbi:MAG: MBL fold metallo-hydrolase [Planctomycetota bacterium]|nr:MBL fold metallo-hydrolase [Planctomycetota bacterium]
MPLNPTITILGSGTALATPLRNCPSYLIRSSQSTLLDCGSGTMKQLAVNNQDFHKVHNIFLTHPHLDHVADLAPLLFARRNPDLLESAKLEVTGWPGFKDHYQKLIDLHGRWVQDKRQLLSIQESDQNTQIRDDFKITSQRVDHMPGALGYRIQFNDGPSLAYSGDTDLCDAIVSLAQDIDVLILECSFPDHLKVKGHLTPKECGQIARQAKCKTLVLSHFYPVCDDHDIEAMCRKQWDGELILAEDNLTLNII